VQRKRGINNPGVHTAQDFSQATRSVSAHSSLLTVYAVARLRSFVCFEDELVSLPNSSALLLGGARELHGSLLLTCSQHRNQWSPWSSRQSSRRPIVTGKFTIATTISVRSSCVSINRRTQLIIGTLFPCSPNAHSTPSHSAYLLAAKYVRS
jgi:hypothetical protein